MDNKSSNQILNIEFIMLPTTILNFTPNIKHKYCKLSMNL